MPKCLRRAARLQVAARAAVGALALATLAAFNLAASPLPQAFRAPAGDLVPPPEPAPIDGPTATTSGPAAEVVHVRWDAEPWMATSSRHIDDTTLASEGLVLPEGANVFAARIIDGGTSPAYMLYEAGGGAFSDEVYPASSIKILAAVGALELAYKLGFTGEAVVDGTYGLWEYYDGAIRSSSNEDYDALVRMAGVDWLNEEFLPSHGYRATRIQEAYGGGEGVTESPSVHLSQEGRELVIPERSSTEDHGCGAANCSNLFELVDSVRRVVLNDEIDLEERFTVAPGDMDGLQDALLGAESWIGPGAADALGPETAVYSKPGWTGGRDCVDVALVVDADSGDRYLIGISAPDDGECAMLAPMAAEVLTMLADDGDGEAMRTDGSVVQVVDGRLRP